MPPKKIEAVLGKQLYASSENNDILKVEDIVRRCEEDPVVAIFRNVDNVGDFTIFYTIFFIISSGTNTHLFIQRR